MPNLVPLQRELRNITASLTLFSLANALIGVFIPLIILQSGAPLWQVAGFYLCYALIKLALNYPIVMMIQRFGVHIGLGIGFAAGALQMVSILQYSNTQGTAFLVLGAGALALSNACLWNSQHIHISRVMDRATKSSNIATMEIINQLFSVLAPLLGGIIGVALGAQWLLAAALLVALIALIPLKGVGRLDRQHNDTVPVKVTYNLKGAPARDLVANFSFNIEAGVGTMVWPIYLAVVIGTFREIGLITSIAAIATVVVVWIAGRRGDEGHDRSVLKQGAVTLSAINILRIFATSTGFIAFISTAYKASLAYLFNAWVSNYYSHAKVHGVQYVMSMEIACDLAYLALWGTLLAVSLVTDSHAMFMLAFLAAAVAAWGCLLITKQGELVESD